MDRVSFSMGYMGVSRESLNDASHEILSQGLGVISAPFLAAVLS